MSFTKRVPDEFGILIPRESGVIWDKQGGGMSCLSRTIEGTYLPIGKIKYDLGIPTWLPDGPNIGEKLAKMDLSEEVPQEHYDSFPEYVQERGHFRDYWEFRDWVEESEEYGWITLYDDLSRFTYGIFDLLDSDPRNRWDSAEELWDAIKESLSFEFEEVSHSEIRELDEDYHFESAIRPIRVLGSKEYKGKTQAEWAEEYKGEIVYLLCPNAE